MSIKEHAGRVLCALAEFGQSPDDPRRGRHNLPGDTIRQLVMRQGEDLSPDQINDAVDVLAANDYVKVRRFLGTHPYEFGGIELTSRGRLEHEDLLQRRRSAEREAGKSAARPVPGGRVFIGHGHSLLWMKLKDFLHGRLGLEWDEFNRETPAGLSTKERIETMLDNASLALLVMTAEDESADGKKVARANVIHEIGLFQGRLGFKRAIVLLEEGCEEFSNIIGLSQIRFPPGRIDAAFHEVELVLEREGVLAR